MKFNVSVYLGERKTESQGNKNSSLHQNFVSVNSLQGIEAGTLKNFNSRIVWLAMKFPQDHWHQLYITAQMPVQCWNS